MRYMTDREFRKELSKIKKENEQKRLQQELRNERHKLDEPKRRMPTSKKIAWACIYLVMEIVLFSEFMMWRTGDLSSLYVLIGLVATLCPIIIKFYSKSQAENTKGGIVYDAAFAPADGDIELESEAGEDD